MPFYFAVFRIPDAIKACYPAQDGSLVLVLIFYISVFLPKLLWTHSFCINFYEHETLFTLVNVYRSSCFVGIQLPNNKVPPLMLNSILSNKHLFTSHGTQSGEGEREREKGRKGESLLGLFIVDVSAPMGS